VLAAIWRCRLVLLERSTLCAYGALVFQVSPLDPVVLRGRRIHGRDCKTGARLLPAVSSYWWWIRGQALAAEVVIRTCSMARHAFAP